MNQAKLKAADTLAKAVREHAKLRVKFNGAPNAWLDVISALEAYESIGTEPAKPVGEEWMHRLAVRLGDFVDCAPTELIEEIIQEHAPAASAPKEPTLAEVSATELIERVCKKYATPDSYENTKGIDTISLREALRELRAERAKSAKGDQ